jgi:membrane associated rhomboid family serine protease
MERHCTPRHDFGVFLGQAKRSPVFIQQNIFASPHDFEEFLRIISLSVRTNLPERTLEETEAIIVRRKKLNHLPLLILASLLLATFLICSAGIERISDSALELGCLTKNSLQSSQLYRFGSSFFLHFNLWHLGLNILCLAIVGRNVQVILGLDRFVNILFLSAFGGSLFSLAFASFDAVIGASGGVMGLIGAYSFLCIKYQTDLPGSVQTSVRMVVLALVLQVVFDIATPAVDSCSHAGGFVTGVLYVSIATNRRTLRAAPPSIAERCIAVAISLAIASALLQFFARYGALLRLTSY